MMDLLVFLLWSVQVLAGLLKPTNGHVYVKRPKSFVFQNPDHQVGFSFFFIF